ncbi:hypothetical protein CC1G_12553 [Coprinopsis cinerea okayama7|uniref:Uncharacterized protein n=1 Tax=Coprinopsis cinerea (strain Okayama-7 / 130 / ATCC MYA-4618 / FGSC 9003) TaxID=240176 RepID=A8PH83_COPC7|nr:hypothetical protein CC1G_12553 [Coprinopsis cinerea okayama7\|eukprot:XP_001841355.2 hypothetical protein CC1G_12553 [Coprinopsis cinerea okayama7\
MLKRAASLQPGSKDLAGKLALLELSGNVFQAYLKKNVTKKEIGPAISAWFKHLNQNQHILGDPTLINVLFFDNPVFSSFEPTEDEQIAFDRHFLAIDARIQDSKLPGDQNSTTTSKPPDYKPPPSLRKLVNDAVITATHVDGPSTSKSTPKSPSAPEPNRTKTSAQVEAKPARPPNFSLAPTVVVPSLPTKPRTVKPTPRPFSHATQTSERDGSKKFDTAKSANADPAETQPSISGHQATKPESRHSGSTKAKVAKRKREDTPAAMTAADVPCSTCARKGTECLVYKPNVACWPCSKNHRSGCDFSRIQRVDGQFVAVKEEAVDVDIPPPKKKKKSKARKAAESQEPETSRDEPRSESAMGIKTQDDRDERPNTKAKNKNLGPAKKSPEVLDDTDDDRLTPLPGQPHGPLPQRKRPAECNPPAPPQDLTSQFAPPAPPAEQQQPAPPQVLSSQFPPPAPPAEQQQPAPPQVPSSAQPADEKEAAVLPQSNQLPPGDTSAAPAGSKAHGNVISVEGPHPSELVDHSVLDTLNDFDNRLFGMEGKVRAVQSAVNVLVSASNETPQLPSRLSNLETLLQETRDELSATQKQVREQASLIADYRNNVTLLNAILGANTFWQQLNLNMLSSSRPFGQAPDHQDAQGSSSQGHHVSDQSSYFGDSTSIPNPPPPDQNSVSYYRHAASSNLNPPSNGNARFAEQSLPLEMNTQQQSSSGPSLHPTRELAGNATSLKAPPTPLTIPEDFPPLSPVKFQNFLQQLSVTVPPPPFPTFGPAKSEVSTGPQPQSASTSTSANTQSGSKHGDNSKPEVSSTGPQPRSASAARSGPNEQQWEGFDSGNCHPAATQSRDDVERPGATGPHSTGGMSHNQDRAGGGAVQPTVHEVGEGSSRGPEGSSQLEGADNMDLQS